MDLWLALVALASTITVTIGSVLVAYFALKAKLNTIEGHTNGLLSAANTRAETANTALAGAVDTLTTGIVAQHSHPEKAPE